MLRIQKMTNADKLELGLDEEEFNQRYYKVVNGDRIVGSLFTSSADAEDYIDFIMEGADL